MAEKTKNMCSGCRDDFYNHNRKDGCWCFASAEIVTRIRVGIWENPPYHPNRAADCLSCYRPVGAAMLKTDDSRVRDTPFPT